MKVLPNRKCGRVKQGLYAVGEMSSAGSLLPFTALVAPIPAEISNPRVAQRVGIAETLLAGAGLQPARGESFAGLPSVGVADLWGKSAGYETVWDAIAETRALGISRRIANVPDLVVPYLVLMMHMDADVYSMQEAYATAASVWDIEIPEWFEMKRAGGSLLRPFVLNNAYSLWAQPFLEAKSLGIKDDDDFMYHPYVKLYAAIHELKKAYLYNEFKREFGIYTEQGVFGLSWVTSICYVLGEDETEVPPALAKRGVEAAVGEDDPRATETDAWEGLGKWKAR